MIGDVLNLGRKTARISKNNENGQNKTMAEEQGKLLPTNEENEAHAELIQDIEEFADVLEENRRIYFYRSPKLRQFWGEEQVELESWKELFFDLIFVAVAFNLGTVLEEIIDEDEGLVGALYFYAQFLVLYTAWYYRMLYLSRFIPSSVFHNILDMVFALLLALAAALISTNSEITEAFESISKSTSNSSRFDDLFFAEESKKTLGFNSPLGFAVVIILLTLVNVFRNIELYVKVRFKGLQADITEELKLREQKAIVNSAKIGLLGNFSYMICLVLSVIGAVIGSEILWITPLFFGFFIVFLFLLFVRVISILLGLSNVEYVPINVGFVIKRIGEFTMLMIGEGVLQIIITDVDGDDLEGHFKTFCLAFLISASIFALAFYFLPYEPDDHAFRKSSLAGLLTTMVSPVTQGSIIAVGVVLKLILKKQAKFKEEEVIIRSFPFGLTLVTTSIIIQRLASHGYHEITKRDYSKEGRLNKLWENIHFERIIFSILFLLSPSLFFILRIPYKKLEGSIFILIALAVFVIIFIIGILEHKLFLKEVEEEEDEHPIKIDEEMMEKYESAVMSQGRSSVLSKRGGCSATHMLHYLRKKSREIDAKIDAVKNGTMKAEEINWDENVSDLVKTANLIQTTFLEHKAKKEKEKLMQEVSVRKEGGEEEEEEEV